MPLHPNENAYQAGKSVEKALHQLMVHVEMVLDLQETALYVLLDIEGAFNNTSYDSMCAALFKHGVDYTIIQWIRPTWRATRLWQLSVDLPRMLQYLGVAHGEVFCHHFYGALLLRI